MIIVTAVIALTVATQDGPLVSKTFEVEATTLEIARHAVPCINQHVTSGFLDIPTIQSSDPALGVIIATNYFGGEGWAAISRDTRSTLRLDARDGRFRFSSSDFVGFSDWALEWKALARTGRRWERVRERLDEQAEKIATCIRTGAGDADW